MPKKGIVAAKKEIASKFLNNAVVISDLHAGCRMGLYPCDTWQDVILDGGKCHKPSRFQMEMWRAWKKFWNEWVPEASRGEDYVLVINGDAMDGRHHNSVTQVTQNMADQKKIAEAILAPILAKPQCKALYWIRGTEAHSGVSGEDEEDLAKMLGAVQNNSKQYSSDIMWLRLGGPKGCLVHFAHTIGTTGRTHYESSAVMAEIGEMYVEAGRWGNAAADVIVRSHRHRYIEIRVPSRHGYTIGVVTPGFQGPTPFTRKVAGGRQSEPQVGGIIIRQGDVDLYTRSFVVGMQRSPEIVAQAEI
jgi:hypothetical protein